MAAGTKVAGGTRRGVGAAGVFPASGWMILGRMEDTGGCTPSPSRSTSRHGEISAKESGLRWGRNRPPVTEEIG